MQKFVSTLHPSKQFRFLLIVMLLCSLAIVIYLPFAAIIKLFLVIVLCIYSLSLLHQQKKWQGIWHDESGWWIRSQNEDFNIKIAGDTTMTGFATVLRFKLPNKRFTQSCLIFKDAMEKDHYRQLTLRLRSK